ncbi:hypothetical protein LCGC14_1861040 [marine sediment metagenome]|uniref:Uncharacterized protein n=1 Tax=marine sediment metagenome TaxID=412755 RepID=A0A0F9J6K9_9ZZZZ
MKDYEKELSIQMALGTLGDYEVSRSWGEVHQDLFRISASEWFLSRVVSNAVNAEHAIDMIMAQCGFSEDARQRLSAKRIEDETYRIDSV